MTTPPRLSFSKEQPHPLPPRLHQVYQLLQEGQDLAGIARWLGVSQLSARRYVYELRRLRPSLAPRRPPCLPERWECLTRRERQVAEALLHGCTSRQISVQLGLTEGTVNTHIHNLLLKTGFPHRTAFCNRYAPAEVFDAPPVDPLPVIPGDRWERLTSLQRRLVSWALSGIEADVAAARLGVSIVAVRKTMQRALKSLDMAGIADLRQTYRVPEDFDQSN